MNLNRFTHYTGKSWLQEKRARKSKQLRRRIDLAWCVVAMGIALAFPAIVFLNQPKAARTPVLLIEGRSVKGADNDQLWSTWIAAARLAQEKWRIAVPEMDDRPIRLVADPEGCHQGGIACARAADRSIWVAKSGEDVDRTTVMMHEIGHLFGLTHIEGDPLMDEAYQGNSLTEPSTAAVAIVKAKLLPHIVWTGGSTVTLLPPGAWTETRK